LRLGDENDTRAILMTVSGISPVSPLQPFNQVLTQGNDSSSPVTATSYSTVSSTTNAADITA
jgi:hypothetical protein